MDPSSVIRQAFYTAQSRRPYQASSDILKAVQPDGGDWSCIAEPGAICRSIMWAGKEVAHVNPRGDLTDSTEGQIAMAIRALPMMDAALRAIIVLAEQPDNLAVIRDLAVSVIAHVEAPAPRISEPEEPGEDEEAS